MVIKYQTQLANWPVDTFSIHMHKWTHKYVLKLSNLIKILLNSTMTTHEHCQQSSLVQLHKCCHKSTTEKQLV